MSARRDNPKRAADYAATIELCNSFAEYAEAGAYNRALLVEAGRHAVQRFPDAVDVLVAVGRMYLAAEELEAARAILDRAAVLAPRDGRVKRLLAGVLLRLGDARSAAATIESEESDDGDSAMRDFRASMKEFVSAQKKLGFEKVPGEVKRKLVRAAGMPSRPQEEPVRRILLPAAASPPEIEGEVVAPVVAARPAPKAAPEPASNFRYVRAPETSTEKASDERGAKDSAAASSDDASADVSAAASEPEAAREAPPSAKKKKQKKAPSVGGSGKKRGRWAIVGVLAALLIGAPVGLGIRNRIAADEQRAKELCHQAATALAGGGPEVSARADKALAEGFNLSPGSVDVATCVARVRAMQVIEYDPTRTTALNQVMTAAEDLGAPPAELAYLDVTAALGNRDAKRGETLVARYDQDPSRRAHPIYELSAGATFEMVGDPRAPDRYLAALGLEPELFFAELRLSRALLLSGSFVQGKRRFVELETTHAGRLETKALAALVGWMEPGAPALAPEGLPEPEVLPLSLRSVVRAMRAVSMTDPAERSAALSAAVAESDTPSAAIFCGSAALSVGALTPAREAAARALETAPVAPAARVLSAQVALWEGHVEEAEKTLSGIDGDDVNALRAIVAYEAADYEKFMPLADPRLFPGAPPASVVLAARERLLGATAPSGARITALQASRSFWSNIIALDLALDGGDLVRARKVLAASPGLGDSPLGKLRLARLLRYEGDLEGAKKALEAAPAVRPAMVERALLAAQETPAERAAVIASLGERVEPERRWLEAYLLGRDSAVKALSVLTKLKTPEGAPQPLRVVVALGFSGARDPRGVGMTRSLLTKFKQNPDVIRAGIGAGILPPSALPAPKKAKKP